MLSQNLDDVRRINLGYANRRLEQCVQDGIITYGVLKKAYDLFLENKRDELVSFYETQISWRTGRNTTRPSASRYANDLDFFINAGPSVLWLTVGKNVLYWGCADGPVEIIGNYVENNPNAKADREAYLISKKMAVGWYDKGLDGQKLDLWKMHPKAKDWLTQRGTIGRLNTKDYFIALIEGGDLAPWHSTDEMAAAANAAGWRPNLKIPEVGKDWGFEVGRMAKTIIRTATHATGEAVLRAGKIKNSVLNETEWQLQLREILLAQNYRCAITGRTLEIKGVGNPWLEASADRIDSNGHYTPDNIQIVSKAANMAKGATPPETVDAFFDALQFDTNEPG